MSEQDSAKADIYENETKRYDQSEQLVRELRASQDGVLKEDGLAKKIAQRYNEGKNPEERVKIDDNTSFFVALREPLKGEISKFFDETQSMVISLGVENIQDSSDAESLAEKKINYIDVADVIAIGHTFETTLPYVKVVKSNEFEPISSLASDVLTLAAKHPEIDTRTLTVTRPDNAQTV